MYIEIIVKKVEKASFSIKNIILCQLYNCKSITELGAFDSEQSVNEQCDSVQEEYDSVPKQNDSRNLNGKES